MKLAKLRVSMGERAALAWAISLLIKGAQLGLVQVAGVRHGREDDYLMGRGLTRPGPMATPLRRPATGTNERRDQLRGCAVHEGSNRNDPDDLTEVAATSVGGEELGTPETTQHERGKPKLRTSAIPQCRVRPKAL